MYFCTLQLRTTPHQFLRHFFLLFFFVLLSDKPDIVVFLVHCYDKVARTLQPKISSLQYCETFSVFILDTNPTAMFRKLSGTMAVREDVA